MNRFNKLTAQLTRSTPVTPDKPRRFGRDFFKLDVRGDTEVDMEDTTWINRFNFIFLFFWNTTIKFSMKTQPVPEVLPENPDDLLEQSLQLYSDSLREIVNYGTHILLWDIEKKRDGKDYNIPTLFFRNIIELGDGISILIRKSSIDPGAILLRSLFENTLGIIYMLEKDEDKRAHCFMVWKAKKDLKFYRQFISTDPRNRDLEEKLKKDPLNFNLDKYYDHEDISKAINSKVRLLKMPKFKEVKVEYERVAQKNRNPNWYSLYEGPRNIQELSRHLGKQIEYEFAYRKYSENVHITSVMKGFVYAGEGRAHVIQIRDFEEAKNVYVASSAYLLQSYNILITKRLQEKISEFRSWYSVFRESHRKILKENQYSYKK